MRISSLGQFVIALGVIGLGVLGLIHDDFAMVWQPVPAWVTHRETLAYASAALLLICGLGLLIKRLAVLSSAVLALFIFSWLILLELPRLKTGYADSSVWLGIGETLEMITGIWILCTMLAKENSHIDPVARALRNTNTARVAFILFALSLVLIGQSHFVYAKETAAMIPSWLPFRLPLAYVTGAGHVAAGLALLFGVLRKLAATLEAIMMSSFVLLLHVPGVWAEPKSRFQWTMLCVAMTITGSAWCVSRYVSKRGAA